MHGGHGCGPKPHVRQQGGEMALFSKVSTYDRARILEAAGRARARRRRRKAIRLYRQVLAVEPANAELHHRIAPLLAETGQRFDSWRSFHRAGRALLRDGHLEKALAVYRDAARHLPDLAEAWQHVARIQRKLQRDRDAMETLLEGRRQLRGRRRRAEAIHLLRRALEIEPWDPSTLCDLARQLARADQESEADMLLERLAMRLHGAGLRRVRGVQWRIEPSLLHTWLWLRAALAAARAEPEPEAF
jgi:tetratricopeptide (TPR) repeat protein